MIAIGELLNPAISRLPKAARAQADVLVHLSNPKRRAIAKAVGYEGISEQSLSALYGPSWGAVQSDLRELVKADLIKIRGFGKRAFYALNLAAFSPVMLSNLFPVQPYALAA